MPHREAMNGHAWGTTRSGIIIKVAHDLLVWSVDYGFHRGLWGPVASGSEGPPVPFSFAHSPGPLPTDPTAAVTATAPVAAVVPNLLRQLNVLVTTRIILCEVCFFSTTNP
jgi:hypothetical protein